MTLSSEVHLELPFAFVLTRDLFYLGCILLSGGMLNSQQIMARLPGASNQQTRHARRLYIGACPKTTEEEMTSFFNDVINRALAVPVEGGAVASVYVSQDKVRIAFKRGVEIRGGAALEESSRQWFTVCHGMLTYSTCTPNTRYCYGLFKVI